ncbi:MAG: hypothetical protein WD266_10180 [Balneolales bacterium]
MMFFLSCSLVMLASTEQNRADIHDEWSETLPDTMGELELRYNLQNKDIRNTGIRKGVPD